MSTHPFNSETLVKYLTDNKFHFTLHEHQAVFTCKESDIALTHMEGQRTKNLFLKEEKGDRIFLVAVPDFKKVDLNKLRYILKSERLTFGKPELLLKYLGVEPGSVTIFGVSNDIEQKVELYIDQIIIGAELIQAHPLRNTASLVITPQELLKFLREIGRREATVVDVPSKE